MTKKRTNKAVSKRPKAQPKKKTQARVVYVDRPIPSIGAQIGDKLQKLGTSLFTRFMGTGDYSCNDMSYNVSKNALIKGGEAKAVKMSQNGSSFVFEHSEYITDVVTGTSGAFNLNSFTLNPQNATTFPWLSNIAINFESYEIEGMLFRFVSTSGESVASTNTALGTVMGTFTYDVSDPTFVSKQQLLQYDDTVDCKFSSNFICGVECDANKIPGALKRLYVGPVAQGADPKFYNYGTFNLATQGGQASNVTIGELWISYRIRFHITKDTNYVSGSSHLSTNAGNVTGSPFSNLRAISGSIAATSTATSITWNNLQVGAIYIITSTYVASAASTFVDNSPTYSSGVNANYFRAGSASTVNGGGTGLVICVYEKALTATSNTLTMTGSPYTCTNTFSIDVYITQLDSNIIP